MKMTRVGDASAVRDVVWFDLVCTLHVVALGKSGFGREGTDWVNDERERE